MVLAQPASETTAQEVITATNPSLEIYVSGRRCPRGFTLCQRILSILLPADPSGVHLILPFQLFALSHEPVPIRMASALSRARERLCGAEGFAGGGEVLAPWQAAECLRTAHFLVFDQRIEDVLGIDVLTCGLSIM